jgi:DNA repair exonuclease SbcCD ATPase subunit
VTAKNSDVLCVKTENDKCLECSPDHLIKAKNGKFIKTIKLVPGQIIQTDAGNSAVKSIQLLPVKMDLYDIQVADVNQYYSNGILSHNSSILDAISFCLFDKCSRAFKASAIMNNQKSSFNCQLDFEIDGTDYMIRREARTVNKGRNVKVDVQFSKVVNGQIESLNGNERRDTNAIIEQYVGRYDDFILTALSVQGNNALFIDKSQTERKELLSQFMGLNIFDKLHDAAIEDTKDVSVMIRNFKKKDFSTELSDNQLLLKTKKNEFNRLDAELKSIEEEVRSIDEKIVELTTEIVPTVDNLDLDTLTSDLYNVSSSLSASLVEIETKVGSISDYASTILQISKSIEDRKFVNGIPTDTAKLRWDEHSKKISRVRQQITLLRQSLDSNEQKLQHLDKHEYDPNCKFCMNNVFVKDAIETKGIVTSQKSELSKLQSELSELQTQSAELSNVETVWDELNKLRPKYQPAIMKKEKLEAELGGIQTRLTLYRTQYQSIDDNIQKYYANEGVISNNKRLNSEILDLNASKRQYDAKITLIKRDLLKTTAEIGSIKSTIDTIKKSINEVRELETKNKLYTLYMESIQRDGVPYQLISNALPLIEDEINNILGQIVDFHIVMDTDGKNINARIVYDDQEWALEMCSGMERFISGLAIRVALINICNLPRPNFLVIDEGMGALDSDNLASLYSLFSYMKTQFDFILLISHVDSLRDIVDGLIDIKKENGFSKIKY